MSSNLLPCPFCGGVAESKTIMGMSGSDVGGHVYCTRCYVEGFGFDQSDAEKLWNTRVQ